MSILDGVQKVLGLFAEGAADLSFSDVAQRLALPRSTASRLLNQMHTYRLLEQDPLTRRYRPGVLLAEASQAHTLLTPLDDACRDTLARLSLATGFTAYLSTLNASETVVLQRLNGSHPVQVLSQPGSRRPALGTAMGRALLSRLRRAEFESLYGRDQDALLPPQGQHAPGTVAALAQRLDQVRKDRCAVAIDEAMPGIGAVAAAVRHPSSQELRGLCVSFVSLPSHLPDLNALRKLVIEEIGALGRQLGDPYWSV